MNAGWIQVLLNLLGLGAGGVVETPDPVPLAGMWDRAGGIAVWSRPEFGEWAKETRGEWNRVS